MLARITSLGRVLDASHPSNLFALAAAAAGAGISVVYRAARGDGDLWLWALYGGVAVFIAWAIGRELDPDDVWSAGLATVPALALVVFAGKIEIPAVLAALVAGRIVVRSTGLAITWLDVLALIAIAGWAGSRIESWPAALFLIAALVWDTNLPDPEGAKPLTAALLGLAAAGAAAWFLAERSVGWEVPGWPGWVTIALVHLVAFMVLVPQRPAVTADHTGETLHHDRLAAVRLLLFGLGIGTFVWLGFAGIASVGPVWAGFTGVFLASFLRAPPAEDAPVEEPEAEMVPAPVEEAWTREARPEGP